MLLPSFSLAEQATIVQARSFIIPKFSISSISSAGKAEIRSYLFANISIGRPVNLSSQNGLKQKEVITSKIFCNSSPHSSIRILSEESITNIYESPYKVIILLQYNPAYHNSFSNEYESLFNHPNPKLQTLDCLNLMI